MFRLVCAIVAMALAGVSAMPSTAQTPPALSPALLEEALSCRSREASQMFASALFLEGSAPDWIKAAKVPTAAEGMIGLYHFAVHKPVAVYGQPVDHVYFLKDWIVALVPRSQAEAILRQQHMERAPITLSEQYFRFVDPDKGPMMGAFAPTGDAMADMMARALGGDSAPAAPVSAPAAPVSETGPLFVGCNYAVVSQAEFLAVARDSAKIMEEATANMRKMIEDMGKDPEKNPARR